MKYFNSFFYFNLISYSPTLNYFSSTFCLRCLFHLYNFAGRLILFIRVLYYHCILIIIYRSLCAWFILVRRAHCFISLGDCFSFGIMRVIFLCYSFSPRNILIFHHNFDFFVRISFYSSVLLAKVCSLAIYFLQKITHIAFIFELISSKVFKFIL